MAAMNEMTRRDVMVGMAALAVSVRGAEGQDAAMVPHAAAGDLAGGAKVFALGGVAATKNANGSERKNVFDGALATGEAVSLHESWAPAGTPAAPAHTIKHSEFIVVIEGTMEFWHDGKTDRATAGDVIYVAYGTNHQVKNVGDVTARYMVFQMGGDTK
jgi:mannose-6-phosphate isomerase-like protein (cupin superfamily)